MQLIRFSHFGEGVIHALSTRHGGVSDGPYRALNLRLKNGDVWKNVQKNYAILFEELGVDSGRVAIAHQEHTDKIVRIEEDFEGGIEKPFESVDAFVSNVPGKTLVVRFADCQGVLMYDPVKRVIGAVHSGWRGNTKNIIGKTLRKMIEEYGCDPGDILVGVGQSLGQCCSEFSDPVNELPEFMHKYIDERNHVDLWSCAEDQILEEGVKPENLEILRRCTVCEEEQFFSFRREKGKTGHMVAVIQLV